MSSDNVPLTIEELADLIRAKDPAVAEFARDLARDDGSTTARACRCCGILWTPVSFNFYDLCQMCFKRFDEQKMRGRFSGPPFDNARIPHFESSDEWIAAVKAAEKQP